MPDDLAPQHDAPLTPSEQQQLSELETTIEKGMQTFLEVGAALAAVRDGRLYRADYGTFEAYCQERWGMTRRNANHLIGAVEVVETLGTTVPKPTSERQARALGKVPEDERGEVWQEAHERSGGKPTAKLIEQLASERSQDATPAAQGAAIVPEPDTTPRATPEPAQQPVHAATPLEVAELQQRLHAAMNEIRDLQAQVHNLHTANDAELKEQQATISRLQGKVASLEGENERLQSERDAAQREIERQYRQMAKAPDAQEFERMQQENAWAHQKFTELKQRIDQAAPLREQAQQRAEAMPKSPLAHHIKLLLQLVDDLAGLLP
jgi:hypothetical protein